MFYVVRLNEEITFDQLRQKKAPRSANLIPFISRSIAAVLALFRCCFHSD